MLTGKMHVLDIPVTMDQINKWENGALIQDAMPNLSKSQREFIMTGSTKEEWEKAFGADEDDQ